MNKKVYLIRYFGQSKCYGYCGTLKECMQYADTYKESLVLDYVGNDGKIEILDGNRVVAYEKWSIEKDDIGEYAVSLGWVKCVIVKVK